MANIRKYWSVGALALLVVFVMMIREPAPIPVQAAAIGPTPSPAPVTVTNTPLPVQGSVSVNNFPATQPVSGTVGISGMATVGNTRTTPLYVRDVDNPAHHPFAQEVNCSVPGGSKSCAASFTVDAGKELVIETASVLGTVPIGGKGFAVITVTTGGTNISSVQLPLTFQASYAGTVDTYVGTQPLRLYADPGSTVTLEGEEQPVGSATFTFDVSGYTVDCGSAGTITNPCPLP